MHKITEKEYNLFCKEFRDFAKKLNITGVEIEFEKCNDSPASYLAKTTYSYKDRCAWISLATCWGESDFFSQKKLKEVARHEVLEMLLLPYGIVSGERYAQQDNIDAERHSIVNLLLEAFKNE